MFWHKNSERHVNVTDATYKCYGTECGDTRETAREDVRFKKSVKETFHTSYSSVTEEEKLAY